MLSESDIVEALRSCFFALNKRTPVNIVDLGMVHRIELLPDPDAPGGRIPGVPPRSRLKLELLTAMIAQDEAGELANAQLVAQVENRLAGLPPLSRIQVDLLETPRWTPGRISPDGRRALGLDPEPFAILNNRQRSARR